MDSFYSNNSIENRQTQGKVTYDTYVTNVSTWSTAPEGTETAPHIYNNYDIEVGMFLVAIEVLESDEGAAWWRNGALVGATDVGGFFQAPATINDFYNVFCVERYGYSIKKEGYELVGWVNNESMVSGYGTDVLALEEPLRGPAYLHPVWAELFDVTYHFNSETSAPEEHAEGRQVTVKSPTELDSAWTDEANSVFIGRF